MSESRYKEWELYDYLPYGWQIDNTCGSPLNGYDFCTNGKSVLNGGKRALVRTIKKGDPSVEFIQHKTSASKNEQPKEDTQDEYIFPAYTVNTLARKKFQEQLLKEIQFDLMVCEIEGWDKKEYIKELQELINEFNLKHL